MSELTEKIEDLTKALEANKSTTPTLVVKDETEAASKYLTPEAQEIMKNKATRLIAEEKFGDKTEVVAKCMFFGGVVRRENVELAVQKLTQCVNTMVEKGYVHSVLSPISSLNLAKLPLQAECSAVVFYPLVYLHHEQAARSMAHHIRGEGELPSPLEDLSVKLEPGEFLAEIRVTHPSFVLMNKQDHQAALHDAINGYLSILPEGTKVVSITQCAISDLSLPYEVKFYNELLQNVKSVSLDYVRSCAVVNGSLKQFNLLLGIRYRGEDGKDLYPHHYPDPT